MIRPILLILALSSCTNNIDTAPQPAMPGDFPTAQYSTAGIDNIYRVNAQKSQVQVMVRRGGLMAKLGHDHIVSSNKLQGFIQLDRNESRCEAAFFVPLGMMEVDNQLLRDQAQLDTKPSAADIAGTKSNMLKSIEAQLFPFAQIRSNDCSTLLSGDRVAVELELHGVTQERQLAIDWRQVDAQTLAANGSFSVLQSDFGITPFSIMNGLIKVEDRLEISFQLTATLDGETRHQATRR